MKLSKKQELDLKSVLYFYENGAKPTDDDIEAYFAWSDRGDKRFTTLDTPGANTIRYGKQYRDVQVTAYKQDWGKYITATDFATEEPRWYCEWVGNVLKKPAILVMWKLFNAPEELTEQDKELLKPLQLFV